MLEANCRMFPRDRHIMRSSAAYSLIIRNKDFKRAPMLIDRGP